MHEAIPLRDYFMLGCNISFILSKMILGIPFEIRNQKRKFLTFWGSIFWQLLFFRKQYF